MKKDEMINLLLFLVKNAKFSAIEAKKIYGLPISEPLRFRVELGAIDSFKRGLPKKVIYLEEDEIDEFQKLDEFIEEEPQIKKSNSNEEVVTGVIKKLFPYLNVDEDTAKVASQHGIKVTPAEEPKKTPKKTEPKQKKIIITQEKRTVSQTKPQPVKKEQGKGKVDQALLDEILKKFHGIKENEIAVAKAEDKRNDQALLDEILNKLQKITEAQEKIKEELQTTKQEKTVVTEHKIHITRKYDSDGLPYDFIDEDDIDDDEFSDYNFEPEEDPEEILEGAPIEPQNQPLDPEELISRLNEEIYDEVTEPKETKEEPLDETTPLENDSLESAANEEESLDEISPVENDSMVETEQPEDVVLSNSDESSEEPLLNESYDKEFEPIEEASTPLDELLKQVETSASNTLTEEPSSNQEGATIEPELENNPYFRKKKILS
ncbi:MAG: hypothetical protein K2O23_00500, partial [Anaeroplasmataceae bacterium]|nr:hypothetical protein [Anaeroplasmataceae bacterium]